MDVRVQDFSQDDLEVYSFQLGDMSRKGGVTHDTGPYKEPDWEQV